MELTILGSCEHHGSVWPVRGPDGRWWGGLERRATIVRRHQKTGPTVMVDSGDILYGATSSAAFEGRADIVGMSAARCDAMGCGNHDFDLGPGHLELMNDLASFPIIASNVNAEHGPLVNDQAVIGTEAGDVLICSIVSADVFSRFNPRYRSRYRFEEPERVIRDISRRWNGRWLVAITHQRTEDDIILSASCPELDVIVGGHVDGFSGLIPPGCSQPVPHYRGPGPVIVKGERLGRSLCRLRIDREGQCLAAAADLVPVTMGIPPDSAVTEAVEPFRAQLDRVIAEMRGGDGDLIRLRRGRAETARLIAAAMRWRLDAGAAVVLAGGVFSARLPDRVRYRDVIDLLPYRSSAVRYRMDEEMIRKLVEHGVSRYEYLDGILPVLDGVRVVIDPDRPVGQRVSAMKFDSRPGDDGRYEVVVQDYLSVGGGGFDLGGPGENTGIRITDCIVQYLEAGGRELAPRLGLVGNILAPGWEMGEERDGYTDAETII